VNKLRILYYFLKGVSVKIFVFFFLPGLPGERLRARLRLPQLQEGARGDGRAIQRVKSKKNILKLLRKSLNFKSPQFYFSTADWNWPASTRAPRATWASAACARATSSS
jgi:hypothetical protein